MFQLDQPAIDGIEIRPPTGLDLEGIARVSVDTWRGAYEGLLPPTLLARLRYGVQEDRHRRFLSQPRTAHRVAVDAFTNDVVGFANGGASRHPRLGLEGEIYELYVQNGFQGRGIGRSLFEAVRAALDGQGRAGLVVWVLATNPSRAFYDRLGGRQVSRQWIRMGGARVEEVAYGWTA